MPLNWRRLFRSENNGGGFRHCGSWSASPCGKSAWGLQGQCYLWLPALDGPRHLAGLHCLRLKRHCSFFSYTCYAIRYIILVLQSITNPVEYPNISVPKIRVSLTFFFFLSFFRAAPVACGGSHARGPIGAVATGLGQSHSNRGSDLHL